MMDYDNNKFEMRETFGIAGLPALLWQKSDMGAFGRVIANKPVDGPIFDLVIDVPVWLSMLSDKDVVVQAGGCMGMYPLYYSSIFKEVYTFEPDPDNYFCLDNNCTAANIHKFNAGLGSSSDPLKLVRIAPQNAGMHRVVNAEQLNPDIPEGLVHDVQMKTIDSLELNTCNLIHLDVELYELEALIGAERTLDKCSPLIVVETGGRPSPADAWLQSKGYHLHKQLRMDAIYKKN